MNWQVTAVGNAGFRIDAGPCRIFIDAFYRPVPGVADPPDRSVWDVSQADLILVTHDHPDHFEPALTSSVAHRLGAVVVGSQRVVETLRQFDRAVRCFGVEPGQESRPGGLCSREVHAAGLTLRAFRTSHGSDHLSWMGVCEDGFRFLHDGDNEDSSCYTPQDTGALDALFIAPWLGSGWDRTIRRLNPGRWFLMHLTAAEIDAHEKGAYLPELCDCVPPGVVCLRPGRRFSPES